MGKDIKDKKSATEIGTLQRDACHHTHQGARDDQRISRKNKPTPRADKGCQQQQERTPGSHKTTFKAIFIMVSLLLLLY